MERLLVAAAVVAVLGLAAVAIGGAATSAQEGDGPIGTLLGKVADKLGVSEDELQSAFREARLETIDEAVADGRLTEEQGERLKERVEEGRPLFLGPPFGDGPRHRRLALCHRGAGLIAEAAAEALDMSKEDVVDAVKDGSSLAELAEQQGMTVDDFEADLLAAVQNLLDGKVADGDITEEQADRVFQRIEEHIDDIVNAHPREDGPCRCWRGFPPHEESGQEESSDVTA